MKRAYYASDKGLARNVAQTALFHGTILQWRRRTKFGRALECADPAGKFLVVAWCGKGDCVRTELKTRIEKILPFIVHDGRLCPEWQVEFTRLVNALRSESGNEIIASCRDLDLVSGETRLFVLNEAIRDVEGMSKETKRWRTMNVARSTMFSIALVLQGIAEERDFFWLSDIENRAMVSKVTAQLAARILAEFGAVRKEPKIQRRFINCAKLAEYIDAHRKEME